MQLTDVSWSLRRLSNAEGGCLINQCAKVYEKLIDLGTLRAIKQSIRRIKFQRKEELLFFLLCNYAKLDFSQQTAKGLQFTVSSHSVVHFGFGIIRFRVGHLGVV